MEVHMSGTVDILNPDRPRKILIVASNPSISEITGWPIGFWWSEVTHPYWEFVENGFKVEIASPDGGEIKADYWSDPADSSGYSAYDLISRGFINSPEHMGLIRNTHPLKKINPEEYSAIFLVGGQGPMYTFYNDPRVAEFVSRFYETGKPTAIVCHSTCVLLKARLSNGTLLVDGKTWTGFANTEEEFADNFVGKRIQPFRIQDEARKIPNTNFIVHKAFKAHAIRDGNLITGQQQYSGAAAAKLVIQALGL
jgi:putative intracellular protease/amidase